MRITVIILLLLGGASGWFLYKAFLHDEPLRITENTINQLKQLRVEQKFVDLPGIDTRQERRRNEANLNELLDRMLVGLSSHPNKRWVIDEMRPTVERMYLEDTEARERSVEYLARINSIVGIASTNGAFATKLIFF